jgi:NitT/TauT family transport system ATP-binding protein
MELRLSGIGHRFGDLTVLDGIDITVAAREVVAVVGPSGCGKSTLLGIAGGLIQPTSGAATTSGAPPERSLNAITHVFQDFALLPWLTVEGNVAFVLEHHPLGTVERRRRVADALARTGLAEFARALPRQLSGGMRQRVGFARALVVEPVVMLLDEPFSALDAQTRDLLIEDVARLWARTGCGALLVTHNLVEAARLADRVVVLSRRPGRIKSVVAIDLPRDQRDDPANAADMAALHARLWALVRDEARAAERELGHV